MQAGDRSAAILVAQILDRDGPSRTHVVATDETKQTGWTNNYLPFEPPLSVAIITGAGK
jgi:hypothetical protein